MGAVLGPTLLGSFELVVRPLVARPMYFSARWVAGRNFDTAAKLNG